MDIPANHLGQYSSHVGSGMFYLAFPKDMDEGDAEFVLRGLELAKRQIDRNQQRRRSAEAESFSWAGVAATG